jgi:heme/copper-type cytochrome/quinol oxidase subunit 1
MFLLEWTASDLLLIALAGIAMIGTVVWLVPSAKVPRKREYSQAEITAYDHQIPRYFIAAAVALMIGGLHIVIKSFPGFWQWLWEAGYGGHLFRDLSNSHIIIVGGGTVLLTGLTWYLLPRFTNRPLFSTSLAGASFWFTIIGVFGFYLAWLILGLVEGNLVRHGMDYMAAKEVVGAWHRVPTRLTASIMGVGYWTYVLNVFLTVLVARHVRPKPMNYLTKFIGVSAAALFIGTVQGVIQVLPANADWIHFAGKFGQYVDPISHAHINLVTGMMVALSSFLVYFSPRMGGKLLGERQANRLFWTLVPGSVFFYATFLFLGLILGGAVNGYGGIQAPALAPFLSRRMPLLISLAGSLMLAGFWVYFITLWRSLGLGSVLQKIRGATPAAFWLVSSLALVIGTFQGLLQALPFTLRIFTTAEEIPNIHAQLNMIGGVLLALMGLVYLLLPEMVGQGANRRLARFSLFGIAGGIGAYYLTTLVTGLLRFGYLKQGMDDVQAAARLGWAAPTVLVLTAVPIFFGFVSFGVSVFQATREYRAEMARDMRQAPTRFSGPMPERLKRIPKGYVLGMEFAGGLFGWPGVGWLFAGQAMPALALLMIGPSIAWAMLPMLFSPYTDTIFSRLGWVTLLVWLPASALLSSLALALYLRRRLGAPRLANAGPNYRRSQLTNSEVVMLSTSSNQDSNNKARPSPSAKARETRPTGGGPPQTGSRRIPLAPAFGIGLVILALISIPLVPLMMGIPKDTVQQAMMAELPERANGAYLAVGNGEQSGMLKLFAWSFALDEFPAESPTINPFHLQSLMVKQKGLDRPDNYKLYHMDDGDRIPLQTEEIDFQRQLSLKPAEPLETGNYMLDIPIGGMFAGREYYYFRVDPIVTALPPMALGLSDLPDEESSLTATTPSGGTEGWLEVFPLSAALISGLMALIMGRRMRQKVRPQEAAWALAFTMFAVAAASQVAGDIFGWSPALARLYYVMGATLVVGWLGLGTWLVLVHRPRLRNLGIWIMVLLSGYGVGLVSLSPVDSARLAADGWHALIKPTPLTVLTIFINSVGTLVLVGGALWSAWIFWRKRIMRERMTGLILLAAGTLIVAAGGSLTRLGHPQYLYIAMSVGVGTMFLGYMKTIQPAVKKAETVQASHASDEKLTGLQAST